MLCNLHGSKLADAGGGRFHASARTIGFVARLYRGERSQLSGRRLRLNVLAHGKEAIKKNSAAKVNHDKRRARCGVVDGAHACVFAGEQ